LVGAQDQCQQSQSLVPDANGVQGARRKIRQLL
jgi:hypothetical protein